jgi:integrase
MARTRRNSRVDSRTARAKLPRRREPYWTSISAGCAIGYRRGAKGGTWIARLRDDEGKQHYEALGAADDILDPDGLTVFSFQQAQEKARRFFIAKVRALTAQTLDGPYSVNAALDDYFTERERRGSKGMRADQYSAAARIRPALGNVEVCKLTPGRIRQWQAEMEKAPKLLRSAKGTTQRRTAAIDNSNLDAIRARKASTNRLLTILKAALTFAFQEGKAPTDDAWRKVKPAKEVDAPIVRFLSQVECIRLVNACQGAFRDLVRGALVTGCRYGELCRLRVADFSPESGTVSIRVSKGGKRRHVALNHEGQILFAGLTLGQKRTDLIFVRDDGKAWAASHQQRPLEEASKIAKLDPPATFHILRHTYASALAAKGVPMRVIADQLGHADTRMTERHYAHLAPSHVAEVVRAALPGFGIVDHSTVRRLTKLSVSA